MVSIKALFEAGLVRLEGGAWRPISDGFRGRSCGCGLEWATPVRARRAEADDACPCSRAAISARSVCSAVIFIAKRSTFPLPTIRRCREGENERSRSTVSATCGWRRARMPDVARVGPGRTDARAMDAGTTDE
jgi:hypothetical protein